MTRFWAILLGIALAGSLLANLLGPGKEVRHVWDYTFFFAAYGFLACVVIVYVSKAAGRWLQRREDYYDPHRAPTEVGEARPESDQPAEDDADG